MTPRERNLADIGLIALRHGLTRHDILRHHGKRCERVKAARRDVALHFRAKDYSWPKIGRVVDRDHSSVMAWAGKIKPTISWGQLGFNQAGDSGCAKESGAVPRSETQEAAPTSTAFKGGSK